MNKNTNKSGSFLKWALERASFYIKMRKMPSIPWRYSTALKILLKSIKEDPVRTIKFIPKFFDNRKGFILLIFGPRVLRDTMEVCGSLGLKPFLLFGTLRGYVLKNDFLSKVSSGDLDFGLLEKDFMKGDLIKEGMVKKGYVFWDNNGYEIMLAHPEFSSLIIDFYSVYKKGGSTLITAEVDHKNNEMHNHYLPPDIFDEFRKITFHKTEVLIPSDPEKFLSIHYGPNWRSQGVKFTIKENKCIKFEPLNPVSSD